MKKIVFFLLLASGSFAQNINSLADAVKFYNVLKVREYLKNGADPNTLVDGDPAICVVARDEGVNVAAIFDDLLNAGANPNSIGKDGYPVLTLSMSKYNAKQATELIKRGADINYKYQGTIPPPLIMAIASKRNWPKSDIYPTLIKFMIDNKADVNVQDSQGTGTLMMAVYGQDQELLKYLLSCKANPNLKNMNGETPLIASSSMGYTQIVDLLLNAGADPNVVPSSKETALMQAAKEGRKDIVVMLLDKGAKTHFKNRWNETALRLAQLGNHKDIVDILKKAGAKK